MYICFTRKGFKRILAILICLLLISSSGISVYGEEYGYFKRIDFEILPVFTIPSTGYEGQEFVISDTSSYKLSGKSISIEEAYEKAYVDVSFSVLEDCSVSIRKNNGKKYERRVRFSQPGRYTLLMNLTTVNGDEYELKRYINIDETPDLYLNISGAQKQMRLQYVNLRNVQNPEFPVKEMVINIHDTEGGERASAILVKNGQPCFEAESSSHLKVRSPQACFSDDGYYTNGSIEFMSAFDEEKDIIFEASSVDGRGKECRTSEKVHIYLDQRPQAAIDMPQTCLRDEGCSYATITVEDISSSDGDTLKREWYIRYEGENQYRSLEGEEGFTDLSGGSLARVSFRKEGTGRFYIKLRVTDVWSEGCMEEYSQGIRVLSDETEASCEVTNAAPVVTAGPSVLRKADIVVFADENNSAWEESKLETGFFERFISKGIDAGVTYAGMDPSQMSQTDGIYESRFQTRREFGYRGSETSFENDLYIADDSQVYMMDSLWTDPDKGLPQSPFTLVCYKADTGQVQWTYQIDTESFSFDVKNSHMYQDDSCSYLYIISSGKTLVISKRTGQPVTVLDTELGGYNFVRGGLIYTYRSDGIYYTDLSKGSMNRLWSGSLMGCARRISGKVVTYYRTSAGSIMKLQLDLLSGQVESQYVGKLGLDLIKSSSEKLMGQAGLNVIGIDPDGRAIVEVCVPLSSEGLSTSISRYSSVIQVYSSENRLVRQYTHSSSYRFRTIPVTDDKGSYNYIAISQDGNDCVSVEVNGIDNTSSMSAYASDRNGDPAVYSSILYSYEHAGKVYLALGGYCTWIYGQGWGNGPSHGYPERCLAFCFDPSSGSAGKTSLLEGCTSFSEYSRNSDRFTIIQTSRNSQYSGQAYIDDQVVERSQTPGTMLVNSMKKHLRLDDPSEIRILVLDGRLISGCLSENERDAISDLAEERGYKIFQIGKAENDVLLRGAVSVTEEDFLTSVADNYTRDAGPGEWRSAAAVSTENGGRLSRTFALEGDKRYSYQYTIHADTLPEKVINIENEVSKVLADQEYGQMAWYVTGSEYEDFDDSILNSYFSYSRFADSGGMYSDCMAVRSAKSNAGTEKRSTISFNIPEGKQGVLSFDFLIFNSSDAGRLNANYAMVDGKRWDINPGKTGKGSYTHPYILDPGDHTLELYCGAYGGKLMTYTYIDALKISFVSKDRSLQSAVPQPDIIYEGDGVYRISGSFETPGQASVFREMKGLTYISGQAGQVSCTKVENKDNQNTLTIEIPAGKIGVSPGVTLNSYCRSGYNVNYTMSTFGTVTRYGTIKSFGQQLSALAASEIYHFPSITGKHTCTSSFSSYRGSSGNFGLFDIFLADRTNSIIEEHRYIKEQGSGGMTLFAGEDAYNGSTSISIELPSSCTEISGFCLTTNEDGKKLYIANEDFSERKSMGLWEATDASLSFFTENSMDDENQVKIFGKGQLIDYGINYWDYEGDPSGGSFWKYTHMPMNDGEFEEAAVILDSSGNVIKESEVILDHPVNRFYKDGRYIVEHWQIDDVSRGGSCESDTGYNRESNHVFMTFYIGNMADAPWIRYIRTRPVSVREGDPLALEVGLDSADGSVLSLDTEVYHEGILIFKGSISEIKPEGSSYAPVLIEGVSDSVSSGLYTAVCTVSSEKGYGVESYSFRVYAAGNVQGMVYHTEEWDIKRQEAGREPDMFWPGEKIMVSAETQGQPVRVTAWIEGEEELYLLEEAADGVYKGCIWEPDMMFRWGSRPVNKKVIFEALYGNGDVKQMFADIVLDNSSMYWMIHRSA